MMTCCVPQPRLSTNRSYINPAVYQPGNQAQVRLNCKTVVFTILRDCKNPRVSEIGFLTQLANVRRSFADNLNFVIRFG
jgi:hypothetical protein